MSPTHTEVKTCCHADPSATPQPPHPPAAHAHAGHGALGGWRGAAKVTLHCLTGCAIGEWMGLALGLSLGLATAQTVFLAVVLAYASGFTLTLVPLMRGGLSFGQAWKIVWVGEAVSIAAMEIVMNLVDYHLGGMRRGMSPLHAQYWIAFGAAAVSGYLAAWPVNYALLRSRVKKPCH